MLLVSLKVVCDSFELGVELLEISYGGGKFLSGNWHAFSLACEDEVEVVVRPATDLVALHPGIKLGSEFTELRFFFPEVVECKGWFVCFDLLDGEVGGGNEFGILL